MNGSIRIARGVVGIGLTATMFAIAPVRMARAQVTPPDLNVCEGVAPCDAPSGPVCDGRGFEVQLTSFTPATTSTSGVASYSYTICSPAAGTCSGDNTRSCLDNNQCGDLGPCSRTCAVDAFRGLSHSDIGLPSLFGGTCVAPDSQTTVNCSSPSRGSYSGVLGDGSCFSSAPTVAKCDSPNLAPGDCLTMIINIAGELNGPGIGAAVLVDKPANVCQSVCMAGPSCEVCNEEQLEDPCLTRTIGFWGTHPWITNDYAPVTVCGKELSCSGPDNGTSNPSCEAGSCDSITEGLCSVGGEDRNTAYIAMVRQLTAAYLNLNASSALVGGTCSEFRYEGRGIMEWISLCEGKCDSTSSSISRSLCIEALDAFNNSQDSGFAVTPAPFDRPAIDDHGATSGADPSECHEAQGNTGNKKLVIGKRLSIRDGSTDCR